MRHLPMAVLAALVALTVVTSGGSPLQGQQKEARRENPLLGTWKQVSGKFNGKEFRPPEGTTLPKHVTPAQFMFVDIDKDGVIRDAAGGSYALTASTYAETNTYSIGDFHGLKERPSRSHGRW